ncbi:MAG: hypothetical protein OXC47_04680, partial [Cyanobacteria bacterium MAG APA_bin_95]|nr:hypothetical protein [Cyanobacteria bacterium MAG APA_bin_95]
AVSARCGLGEKTETIARQPWRFRPWPARLERGLQVFFMFHLNPTARLFGNPFIKLLTAAGLLSTLTLSCLVALC